MLFKNPLLRGMYPDPSICRFGNAYYLVCSSFEYFPGVPLFKSVDLISWEQVGNVLSRPSQLDLSGANPSDGVFAPTLREHDGVFYMITTCMKSGSMTSAAGPSGFSMKNFFVTARDPEGPWSDPVYVDIEGIDPSLYWEDGRMYVQYAGRGEILQAEIDAQAGTVLDGPRVITRGCGGRNVEGPHMWLRGGWHYLMLAEGGTREGHMVTLMRGRDVWGPFEPCPHGPILSNRDFSREPIQRTGHADWVVGPDGCDYLVHLGVRELAHRSLLGRETMLTQASWTDDGWLLAQGQRCAGAWECDWADVRSASSRFVLDVQAQELPPCIVSPQSLNADCFEFTGDALVLRGNGNALGDGGCCWLLRQPEFSAELRVRFESIELACDCDQAGVVVMVSADHHASLYLTRAGEQVVAVLRQRVGDIDMRREWPVEAASGPVDLAVKASKEEYRFYLNGCELGASSTEHVTVEVAGTQNTGVMNGVFVAGHAGVRVTAWEFEAVPED